MRIENLNFGEALKYAHLGDDIYTVDLIRYAVVENPEDGHPELVAHTGNAETGGVDVFFDTPAGRDLCSNKWTAETTGRSV